MAGAIDFLAFRQANEKNNEKTLAESGFEQTATVAHQLAKTAKVVKQPAKPKAPKEKKPAGSGAASGSKKRKADVLAAAGDDDSAAGDVGLRRSGRRQPTRAANAETEAEKEQIAARNAEEERLQREIARREKHADRRVEANEGGTHFALGQAELDEEFRRLAVYDENAQEKPAAKWEKGKRPHLGTKKLQDYAQDFELRSIVKIIPERIYSMVVHPDPTRDLVFAGDKSGNLALWDCTHAGERIPQTGATKLKTTVGDDGEEGGDDEEEQAETNYGRWWNWRAHRTNSVSWLKFRPGQMDSIYSSAYDGTLRVTHFETGQSEEVIDGDGLLDDSGDALIHSFDFDPTGNELWVSDNDGGIIWRDLRQPKKNTRRWNIDRYKVGCISVNQANPDLAATAHLKRYMALWDLKALRGMKQDATIDEIIDKTQITHHYHAKACSSAYFDPTGTRLATTSYDDFIRIWEVDPRNLKSKAHLLKEGKDVKEFTLASQIKHNCQVGRYVTVFRAHWSTVPTLPPHLHVGSMDRSLDLYSPSGNVVANFYDADHITAVPAVTACHPTQEYKYYGGSASGKVSFFTKPLATED